MAVKAEAASEYANVVIEAGDSTTENNSTTAELEVATPDEITEVTIKVTAENGKEKTYTFQIFSSYVETSDFDYLNLESYNGLTWLEHLQKLKNKSQYQTDLSLEENKKVLVLQTCSFDAKYKNYRQKYRVVVAIEQ